MSSIPSYPSPLPSTPETLFVQAINGRWHRQALQLFMVVVVSHWMEHIFQAVQIYALGWPRPKALGALGMLYPSLVSSEWLHYAYALVMLLGLFILRHGFGGRSLAWWLIALGIQFWHHFEHGLLFVQALFHFTLFGSPVPTSIAQLFFPRVELHLFYNGVVFIPMVVAMYLHRRDAGHERPDGPVCNCATHTARRGPALA